jgi:RNA polymerase sigma-70 factor (ECF subfamily)
LPADVSWDDLLQEAFARVISGTRRQPPGVPTVVFLAGVMRSLRTEHWRRVLRESRGESQDIEPMERAPDPERCVIAWQELTRVQQLFVDDPLALQIVSGLAEGLSAEEIRRANGINKIDYDSARKRMRRVLLREGLTCEPR